MEQLAVIKNTLLTTYLVVCGCLGISLIFTGAGYGGLWLLNMQTLTACLLLYFNYFLRGKNFLFSSGFWLIVNVVLYFFVKSFYLTDVEIAVYNTLQPYIIAFLLSFGMASIIAFKPQNERSTKPVTSFNISNRKLIKMLFLFFFLKIFFFFFRIIVAGDATTVLDVSAATQNQGMSYISNIALVATYIYYLILNVAYSKKKWIVPAVILTVLVLLENIMNASRLPIVLLILINAYFYDKYIKKVKMAYLALFAPFIIFIVSFFGVVRGIEIGNLDTLASVFNDLINDVPMIIELFVTRLDMLPNMLNAYTEYQLGALPQLYGKSYIYMFLHAVPRNIWEAKPLLSCALVTSVVEPGLFADGINLFCSIIIEGIMNFGMFGVIVSGVFTGLLGRILDEFKDGQNPYKILIYIVFFTFPMGLFNEGFHSNYISVGLYNLFLIFLAIGLVNLKIFNSEK